MQLILEINTDICIVYKNNKPILCADEGKYIKWPSMDTVQFVVRELIFMRIKILIGNWVSV